MSNLPTLFKRGALVANDPKEQKILDDIVPIEHIINWFKSRKGSPGIENKVLVLKSETGSGKSTAFPAELYINLVKNKRAPGIICTQPRTLTSMRNVFEILDNYAKHFKLGDTIGWSTKFNKLRPRKYGLLSATIGTLKTQLSSQTDEEIIEQYGYIIIDEVHERSLQLEQTLYMLKNLLLRNAKNPACPFVVLMSATINPQKFIDYFSGAAANLITVTGKSFKIEQMWEWNENRKVNNYTSAAADVVRYIIEQENIGGPTASSGPKDILIFMPGLAEIRSTAGWLDRINKSLYEAGKPLLSILQIDAAAQKTENEDYQKIDLSLDKHRMYKYQGAKFDRRVIISTNVAETGLTLHEVKYVIDSGFNRETEFNPHFNVNTLITKPAPKSRITQRIGRCGRKFPGVFYPLYPRYVYEKLQDQQYPNIVLEDISPIVLSIIKEQIVMKKYRELHNINITDTRSLSVVIHSNKLNDSFSIRDIDMLETPSSDSLVTAIEKLYSLGFIDPFPVSISAIGSGTNSHIVLTAAGEIAEPLASLIPLESIRMILAGWKWEVSILDLISIAAFIETDLRDLSSGRVQWHEIYAASGNYYELKLAFADSFVEPLLLLAAVKKLDSYQKIKEKVTSWGLNFRTFTAFLKKRDEIIDTMLLQGLDVFVWDKKRGNSFNVDSGIINYITKLKYCIYEGYRNNMLFYNEKNKQYQTAAGLSVMSPAVFTSEDADRFRGNTKLEVFPKIILYHKLEMDENKNSQIYELSVDYICIMDGIVNVDLNYIM